MTEENLPKMLLSALEKELGPLGFKLALDKKKAKSRRRSMSVSAAFVRAVDKQRTERFHLLMNHEMLKGPGFRVSPSVGVRFEEVEKIFHRTSGYDREQQKESVTVGIDLWRAYGRDQYQVALTAEADLGPALAQLSAIFHDKAEPYFAQFSTLAAVDAAINDQPGDECVHRDMGWVRSATGLIVARLVDRADFDQLVSVYREAVHKKAPPLLPRFELLLNDLGNLGQAAKRHAILGRNLPSPLREYLNIVEQRLADIRKMRAGGPKLFEQEATAGRKKALEEYEQALGQNPLFDSLLGQLKYAEALQAPATGLYQQHLGRNEEIGDMLNFAVFEHLGYGPIEGMVDRLNEGVDLAHEYFFGDWWKASEEDARALDKSRPDHALVWWDVLSKGLLLCGLTGRWDDAAKLCSWFDERVDTEYPYGQVSDAYMALFLCVASSLRPQPIPGVESILARVKACRDKRPRLLCSAWEAAVARDQKAFDKAFKDSVEYFLKHDADDGPVNFWVALDQSLVWLIAERNGLKFPALPEEVDAAVVRRQTIGL